MASSPVGILIYNGSGDCIAANRAAAEAIGGTKAQVLKQNYHELTSWKTSGLYDAALRVLQTKTKKRHEIQVKTTFGKMCTLDIHLVPIDNGEEYYLFVMLEDITGRKRVEEKIARFGSVFQNVLNEIYLFDTDTLRFFQVNKASLQNLGYSMRELKQLTPLDINPEFTPESFEKLLAPLRNNEIKKVIFETERKRKDQTFYPAEIHLQLLAYENKTVFCSIVLDITEKKHREVEQRKLEAQFQQAQKMESVGRLAGGVAHDYNNCLSVIMGFTELARAKVDSNNPLCADFEEILKAARRATDITRQLLAFARKETVAPKVLDLNRNVESMLKMIQRLIGENIDLTWLPGAGLWPVKMDPSQIDQILANLCVNARDAIAGVGKIIIETKGVVIDTDYCANHPGSAPGEFTLLMISDNGCGMGKELLNHIFEPFFTTKAADKGTGLGLATVYGIVKQNNGFIDVTSEPGKGTTIKIYLPRNDGKPVDILKENKEIIPQGDGETILVVEDDPAILKLVQRILNDLGYVVLTAGTPNEAIHLFKDNVGKIHLIVTDLIMPEMNGSDMVKKLQSFCPGLKNVFMSGYTADIIAHQGVLDEGMHFVQKPFSKRDLATIVRKTLDE
jgi:two-component system cell cycle sensor histidine kinase/response regulator CckA